MLYQNDFERFAVKDRGIGSLALHQYKNTYLNPSIIEERHLHAISMDVFSRLQMDGIIFIPGPIDDDVANIIQAQILYLASAYPERDIQMYINSPGGSVTAGLGIYDTMQLVRPDVATTCTGLAASMGSVLLCAGAPGKRTILPHARVMIHQPLGGVRGQASDILIEAKEIEKIREELYTIIADHSGQPYERVFENADRNYWMTVQEAVEYGMVDRVLRHV